MGSLFFFYLLFFYLSLSLSLSVSLSLCLSLFDNPPPSSSTIFFLDVNNLENDLMTVITKQNYESKKKNKQTTSPLKFHSIKKKITISVGLQIAWIRKKDVLKVMR